MVTTTLTTVGYGDICISKVHAFEQILIMITQIVGFYYFSRIQQEMLNWKSDPSIPEMLEEHKRELDYFIYSIDN